MLICGLEATPIWTMADMIIRTYCTMDVSLIYVNKRPTRCNYTEFILSVNCFAFFFLFLNINQLDAPIGVMIPETVIFNFALLTMSKRARNMYRLEMNLL